MRFGSLALGLFVAVAADAATVRLADDGRALVNPGMGWTMHYYSNIPSNYGSLLKPGDSCAWFPGCSTVYLRIPWAYLEPEEGKFNWSAIDTPAQRWLERGGQIAFRITCSENWERFATPEWVKDAGARGTFYAFGKGPDEKGPCWDPDFGDGVFLAKLENFIRAFAKRYDGRRDVAFVDIGSYGLWGEGHTFMSSKVPEERRQVDIRRHIDLWRRNFRDTQLVISDDVDGHDNQTGFYPILDYARSKGVGWRDDSILVQPPPRSWYHADQAERYWRTLPVVIEHEHYGSSMKRGAWRPALLEKSVEDMHASFMSIHGDAQKLLDENRETIDRINRRIGYRFQLRELTWPDEIEIGSGASSEPFRIAWTWANAGVAPSYRDFFPCLTIKAEDGGIIAVLADAGMNLRNLPVAGPGKAKACLHEAEFALGRWSAPTFPSGTFEAFVSVGDCDGTPIVELPLPDDDGHRRYRVGKILLSARRREM